MLYYYIKLNTNQFPLHQGDIILEHPEITEDQIGPDFPCPPDFALVRMTERPVIDRMNQDAFYEPIFENGEWTIKWNIVELSDEQKAQMIFLKEQEELRNKPPI